MPRSLRNLFYQCVVLILGGASNFSAMADTRLPRSHFLYGLAADACKQTLAHQSLASQSSLIELDPEMAWEVGRVPGAPLHDSLQSLTLEDLESLRQDILMYNPYAHEHLEQGLGSNYAVLTRVRDRGVSELRKVVLNIDLDADTIYLMALLSLTPTQAGRELRRLAQRLGSSQEQLSLTEGHFKGVQVGMSPLVVNKVRVKHHLFPEDIKKAFEVWGDTEPSLEDIRPLRSSPNRGLVRHYLVVKISEEGEGQFLQLVFDKFVRETEVGPVFEIQLVTAFPVNAGVYREFIKSSVSIREERLRPRN